MEFSFSQNKKGDRFLGLMMKGARGKVVTLSTCHIAPPWFTETLQRVFTWWEGTALAAFHPHHGTGALRNLTMREGRRTQQKMVILTVSSTPEFALTKTDLERFKAAVGGGVSLFLRVQQCIKGQPTQFYEMHLGGRDKIVEELHIQGRILKVGLSPTAFFQPNTLQAEELYTAALEMIPKGQVGHLLDLYAGTATLSMVFASRATKITAIELNPNAVLDARENLQNNGIRHVEVLQGDVGELLSGLSSADLVIVDPPRTGLGPDALAHLRRLAPPRILYISCNPKTFAANLLELPGYRLRRLRPVDQFPHTPHIELVGLLERE
jgi:23S rRNA (uracil1939-C5)-methyltransferase